MDASLENKCIGKILIMKTLFDYFVYRSIFYHSHILVRPKQIVLRSLHFWSAQYPRHDTSFTIKGICSKQIKVEIFKSHSSNNKVIVLIHGHFSDKNEFNYFIPELLNKGYDVAIYNLYGNWEIKNPPMYSYGIREKNDLHNVINSLNQYENIHLVGHSLGAAVIAEYAHTYFNEKVKSLVMIALYKSIEEAIRVGVESPLPYVKLPINPTQQLETFYLQTNIDLRKQNMSNVLANANNDKQLLIFGRRDFRAPMFRANTNTQIVEKGTHTNFFTSQRKIVSQLIDDHIKALK